MILIDEPNLVEKVTVELWKGGNHYYNTEEEARRHIATHDYCSCGNVKKIQMCHCDTCRIKKEHEIYLSRKELSYDNQVVYSIKYDVYFFDFDEIKDYCHEHDMLVDDLQLVSCVLEKLPQPESCNDFADFIYDTDFDIPDEIEEAYEHLRKVIMDCKDQLKFYYPDKYRIVFPEEFLKELGE